MATTTSTTIFIDSSAHSSRFELRSLDPLPSSESAPISTNGSQSGDLINHDIENEFSLPPVDGGKDAWLFLAGAFMIEALVWGFPFTFGIFQSYYSEHPSFKGQPGIPLIGTLQSGIMYLSSPLVFYFLSQFPHWRRKASIFGLVLCTASFIGASFATTVPHLALTQGVLFALGGGLLYSPCIIYVDEWFVARKGLAYGIMWGGTGVSGVCLPIIMNHLLQHYTFRVAHRASAIALILLSAPLLYFIKPRIPLSSRPTTRRKIDLSFLRSRTFWLLQTGNILQGLGFFLPSIYIPTFAQESLSLSPGIATLLLSLINGASILGQVLLGHLSDHTHISLTILISTLSSSLSILLLWGLSSALPTLIIFALAYGFFAGGYTSTYAGSCQAIKRECPNIETGMVFGFFAAGRGVGNIICGPISEWLIEVWRAGGKGAYGSGMGGVVIFSGVCVGLAVVGGGSRWMK